MKKMLAIALALCMILSCMAALAEAPAATYTYNVAMAEFPTNWSPFQQQTATDSSITDWTLKSRTGYLPVTIVSSTTIRLTATRWFLILLPKSLSM